MKAKNIIIVGGVVTALAAGYYFMFLKKKKTVDPYTGSKIALSTRITNAPSNAAISRLIDNKIKTIDLANLKK